MIKIPCMHVYTSNTVTYSIFFIANYCGEPVAVENGYISHSSGVVFGSFVTFTCFPGFSLLGSANITCQANQWTSRPQCVCKSPYSLFRTLKFLTIKLHVNKVFQFKRCAI